MGYFLALRLRAEADLRLQRSTPELRRAKSGSALTREERKAQGDRDREERRDERRTHERKPSRQTPSRVRPRLYPVRAVVSFVLPRPSNVGDAAPRCAAFDDRGLTLLQEQTRSPPISRQGSVIRNEAYHGTPSRSSSARSFSTLLVFLYALYG